MKCRMSCIMGIVLGVLCVSACDSKSLPQGAAKDEILTMEPVEQDKTMITVQYEYGVAYKDIETLIEEEFPNVDVVMIHDGSDDSQYPLRQNLVNGLERDIMLCRSLPAIDDIAEDELVDLSAQEFVGNYYLSSLDPCAAADGKLYYLPGPSDIYGVVYDKTLFEEQGWEVPHSYSEFTELIDTINQSGLMVETQVDGQTQEGKIKALQPAFLFADAVQIIFDTFSYDQVYRGVENQQWLMEYQSGKSSMVCHMEPAVETFLRLKEDGIFSEDDFKVRPRERSQMLYQEHSVAMIIENQNAYTSNIDFEADESKRHEVGMFPFWTSDEPESDYVYSMPSYYMAVSKEAAEESGEKRQLLLDILAYLSEPETQKKMVGSGMQISNVQGVPIVENEFSKEVKKTIEEGRIIGTFSYAGAASNKTVEWALWDTVDGLFDGTITVEEWLEIADKARDEYLSGQDQQQVVYGQAQKTFTRLETAQLVGDMYRHETGAPIALVFVGFASEGVNGYLYQGDITDDSLHCISPSLVVQEEKSDLAVGKLTGQQIMDFLSGKEGAELFQNGQHMVASGLDVEYAPWREPGERLLSCKLPDGTELELDQEYEVAYFEDSLIDGQTGEPAEIVDEKIYDGTWEEHFISWLQDMGGTIKDSPLTTKLIWE